MGRLGKPREAQEGSRSILAPLALVDRGLSKILTDSFERAVELAGEEVER